MKYFCRRIVFLSVLSAVCFLISAVTGATADIPSKSSSSLGAEQDVYYKEGMDYLENQMYEQASQSFEAAIIKFPGTPIFYYQLGIAYLELKQYTQAINILTQELSLLAQIKTDIPWEMILSAHYQLADAYNGLGLSAGFSEELCRRILYQIACTFEISSKATQDKQYMGFLTKTYGRLLAGNSKQTDSDTVLPADTVDQQTRQKKIDKLIDYLKLYQKSLLPKYELTAADMSFDSLIARFYEDLSKINSIHYLIFDVKNENNTILSEVYYLKPDKCKIIQSEKTLNFVGVNLNTTNTAAQKIIKTSIIDPKTCDYISDLCKPDLAVISRYYNIIFLKAAVLPDFLVKLYGQNIPKNLYLVDAILKDQTVQTWPPVIRIELFIDSDKKLVVARREYWRPAVETGVTESLGRDIVVTAIKQLQNGINIAGAGYTAVYADFQPIKTTFWEIDVVDCNAGVTDKDFGLQETAVKDFFSQQ